MQTTIRLGTKQHQVYSLHRQPERGVLKRCTPYSSNHNYLESQKLEQTLPHVRRLQACQLS